MSAPCELPKGLLRYMLERFLPRDLKGEAIRGDLLEEFRARAGRSSPRQAHAWYRRQSRRILWAVAWGRISRADRGAGVSGGQTSARSLLDGIAQDTAYTLRRFRRSPGYALIAIVTIAIGVGANTAIFSVLDAVILQPLPFPEPERLVQIWETNPQYLAERNRPYTDVKINALSYNEYAEQNRTLTGMAYMINWRGQADGRMAIGGGDSAPEWVGVRVVSASFFSVLGIEPVLGRAFLPEEVGPARPSSSVARVAILAHDIWVRRYGSDPDIIGREISTNSIPRTVVGVLPERFAFPPISDRGRLLPSDVEVYLPLYYGAFERPRDQHHFNVLARVAPGRSPEDVRNDLQRISLGLARAYPKIGDGWSVVVTPVQQLLARDFGADLYMLMGTVGFVLLIACVNLAHLLLAMGSRRKAELAVRIAIGGSRRRQIQLLLTESLLLSVLGGGTGLIVARSGLNTLLSLVPADMPRAAEAGLDGTVLAFTLGISLATGLLFGLLPALRASDVNLVEALKATKSANTHGRRRASSTPLIVIQVALTLMLLVGASVLGKSFFQLRAVDRGFRSENILVMALQGGQSRNGSEPRGIRRAWTDRYRTLEAVRSMPGVISVAIGELPLSGSDWQDPIQFKKYDDETWPIEEMTMSHISHVSPGYLETLGIPIVRGEGLPEWDGVNDWRRYNWSSGCEHCTEMDEFGKVVVSESFAAAAWPGQDPIGKELGLFDCCWTVAGVARDVSYRGVDDREAPARAKLVDDGYRVYIPWIEGTLLVRTAADPMPLVPAIREAILAIDDMTTIDVSTLDVQIHDSLARPRFHMLLGGIFAAVALLLALVGLYGVVAYTVAQRTHEIGVRIALGAQGEDIRALVLRNGLTPVVFGVVLGIAGVLASIRVLEALLYGMSALDPSLIAGLSVMLVLVTAVACYVPACRASAVDPVLALSHE